MLYEERLLKLFRKHIILTRRTVVEKIGCSYDSLGRFLRKYGYYNSCNKNGCYYIMTESCSFDENGLFFYNEIMFSKYRTLKKSVFNFVEKSESGITTVELMKILGTSSRTQLSNLFRSKDISRQAFEGTFYYFSADNETGLLQRESRNIKQNKAEKKTPLKEELPPVQSIIAILTVIIIKTGVSAKQIKEKLKKKGLDISTAEIKSVLDYYNIYQKKT
jgi:hypothetical protein